MLLIVRTACAQHAVAQMAAPSFLQEESILNSAVQDHLIPGAVLIVFHHGKVVYRRCYGSRSLEPVQERMTLDTVFDMASLTKPLMTATAVMQLYEQGKLSPNDPVSKYVPDFAANGKQDITIRQLLTHYSGLPPDISLADPWEGKQEAYTRAFAVKPIHPPGVQFVYSDVNFIVLGALVEKISGLTLDEYAQRFIIAPLSLKHTRYLPPVS